MSGSKRQMGLRHSSGNTVDPPHEPTTREPASTAASLVSTASSVSTTTATSTDQRNRFLADLSRTEPAFMETSSATPAVFGNLGWSSTSFPYTQQHPQTQQIMPIPPMFYSSMYQQHPTNVLTLAQQQQQQHHIQHLMIQSDAQLQQRQISQHLQHLQPQRQHHVLHPRIQSDGHLQQPQVSQHLQHLQPQRQHHVLHPRIQSDGHLQQPQVTQPPQQLGNNVNSQLPQNNHRNPEKEQDQV
jgi:hypothetical protein